MKYFDTIFKSSTWAFLLLLLAIFLLYSNTLQAPFTFDDAQIVENYFIRINDLSWENLQQITTQSPNKRRWLPNISFALNYYLDGYNVLGYHLVNILLHIAVAFSFYALARKTLSLLPVSRLRERKAEIAIMAALVWAVHPLQTNGVTYIVQRMTSMATLFFLLSLLSYIKGRTDRDPGKKVLLFLFSFVLGLLALLSKENSGMLPVIILGYEFFILAPLDISRKNWPKILPAAGGLLIVFALICWIFLGNDPFNNILQGYGRRDFTLYQRFLTESRIVTHYLSLLLLPLPARLNLAYDLQFSTGFLAPPQTLLAFIFLAGLTLLIMPLYRRDRLTAFALFWFLANLVIESSIIPLELIFEHRMYVPSMFLILATVTWVYRLSPSRNMVAQFTLLPLLVLLALFTWQRNNVWKTEVSLWSDVVAKSPDLARGYVNLGKAYGESGEHGRAEQLLRKAITLAPEDSHSYLSLGAALENQNRPDEALYYYHRALELRGADQGKLYRNLARLYLKLPQADKAVEYAIRAREINPYNYDANVLLAAAYFKTGNFKQAETSLLQALNIFPDKGDLLVQLGVVYENQNRLREAAGILQKAVTSKDVNLAKAYNTLGIVYWRLNNYQQSVAAAKQAIEKDPHLLDAYLTLGITYQDMGLQDLAMQQFIRGWEQGLDIVAIFNTWAVSFMNMNQTDKAIYYLNEAIKLEPDRKESLANLAKANKLQAVPNKTNTQ